MPTRLRPKITGSRVASLRSRPETCAGARAAGPLPVWSSCVIGIKSAAFSGSGRRVLILRGVCAREVSGEEKGEEHDRGCGPEGRGDRGVAHVVGLSVEADVDDGAVDERGGD